MLAMLVYTVGLALPLLLLAAHLLGIARDIRRGEW